MYVISHCLIPRHTIQSGVWNTANLAYNNGDKYTIMNAMDVWYRNGTMSFRDICRTPSCNEECPEQFIFNTLQPNVWPVYIRITIATVVLTIALVCILLKVRECTHTHTHTHLHEKIFIQKHMYIFHNYRLKMYTFNIY